MAVIVQFAKDRVKDVVTAFGFGEPTYKMLVVGETGSGKTSFLNLLCNCRLVQELGFADGVEQFHNFNDIKLENAQSRAMESKTSDAKYYNVKLEELKVGLIDTPGFGDSRGMERDRQNVKQIVSTLEGEEYVNCVCLVVNGRNSRMSATLRYVLTEVTAILPREILSNVIVVFTNTADPLDLNFDPTSFQEFFGREIEQERVFFIENPYCRFEKAKKQTGKLPKGLIAQSLKKSFDETGQVLKKMNAAIKEFKKVHTRHFATLYQKKLEVERKVMKLLTAYDNQTELEDKIAQAEEAAKAALATKSLNADYRSTQTIKRWKQSETDSHNTLCGAKGCYSNCHRRCNLDKSFDKEVFRHCACMRGGTYCTVCGHHYNLHYHDEVLHELETYQKEWVDEGMKSNFEAAKSMEDRWKMFKQKLDRERTDSEKQRKTLSEQLLLTIEEFQKLGVNRNYAKLLENQLAVVEHRLEGTTGAETRHLRKTKDEIEKKLKLVEATLNEPWSKNPDAASQKVWACQMLGVGPSPTTIEVERAYRELARSNHPDKATGDTDYFKRIQRARDVLVTPRK